MKLMHFIIVDMTLLSWSDFASFVDG